MKLSVKERVGLTTILKNSRTGFADHITVRAMLNELEFSEEERDNIQMQDVTLPNGRTTTQWNPEKAKKFEKDFHISKERDKVLRKVIVDICERMGAIVDGVSTNVFATIKWSQDDLNRLGKVVDKMDQSEAITEQNFDICKEIKDKQPQDAEDEKSEKKQSSKAKSK